MMDSKHKSMFGFIIQMLESCPHPKFTNIFESFQYWQTKESTPFKFIDLEEPKIRRAKLNNLKCLMKFYHRKKMIGLKMFFLLIIYKTTMLRIKKSTLVTIIKTNIFNQKLLSNKSKEYLIIKETRGNMIINRANTSGGIQPGTNVVGHGENGKSLRKRAVLRGVTGVLR